LLIGYLEPPDFEQACAGMAGREVNTPWQDQIAGFFEIPKGSMPTTDASLQAVFHLD
jgi:L-rhamnose mutarotase